MINFLTEKFNIVLEHGTDVPGLADGLKHLDGFISLTEKLGFYFYKKSFTATRSAISGTLDPIQSLGLDKAIEELSFNATSIMTNSKSLCVTSDFNFIVTGTKNISEAAKIIKEIGLEGLLPEIVDRIVNLITDNNEHNTLIDLSKEQLLDKIKCSGIDTIVIKLFVNRMDVVGQLCSSNSTFINACKTNFLKLERHNLFLQQKNIAIHYRLGDTAVFPLPNGKFVAAWGDWRRSINKTSAPEILDSPNEAAYKPIDFTTTINTIEQASDALNSAFQLTLLSDGYERGINRIIEFNEHLQLLDSDIEFITNWAESTKNTFIQKIYDAFESKNVTLKVVWGENSDSFMESVKTIAAADLLFVGVGGFSKAIFNIYNLKDDAIILGPANENNNHWLIDKVRDILTN